MAWPLSQDYNEAIQDPRLCFADPELRAGEVVTNALGLPVPRSGNYADVYEVRAAGSDRRWAVKCFTRAVPGQRERYAAVSAHLAQAKLRFMVDFQYLESGIRIHGAWYPVLKMDWVEGLLLNEFVRQFVDRPAMLEALAELWLRLARRLRQAGLAHGDLQHGNVLLVPGRDERHLGVKLIDYDGMFVPALAGVPSGEAGHSAYQHPQRLREGTYNQEVDRFPLLVVSVAIRALALAGRVLWETYDNGDNLLFTKQDFEAPSRSPLFADLLKLADPPLRLLVEQLIDAARQPPEQTPLLAEAEPREDNPDLLGGEQWWMSSQAEASVEIVAPRPRVVVAPTVREAVPVPTVPVAVATPVAPPAALVPSVPVESIVAEPDDTTRIAVEAARERIARRRLRGCVLSAVAVLVGVAVIVAFLVVTASMLRARSKSGRKAGLNANPPLQQPRPPLPFKGELLPQGKLPVNHVAPVPGSTSADCPP